MDAPNEIDSSQVRISFIAILHRELSKKTDSTRQNASKNTNRFADLARAADPVQSSRWDRQKRPTFLGASAL
eukprot:8160505-Pyramimonas_sp.AAC.1